MTEIFQGKVALMNLNLKGICLCLKYELIHMTQQGGGVIVNTSSVAGHSIGFAINSGRIAGENAAKYILA